MLLSIDVQMAAKSMKQSLVIQGLPVPSQQKNMGLLNYRNPCKAIANCGLSLYRDSVTIRTEDTSEKDAQQRVDIVTKETLMTRVGH